MVYLEHHNNNSQAGSWRICLQFPEKASVHRQEQYTWESGKSGRARFKVQIHFNIQKTKIMASGPITSWQIDGETMETDRFISGGSKITADGDCSCKIKRLLLLVRKAMTNLESILKSKDIILPTKVRLVKAMVFPVWSCMDVRVGL